MARWLTEFVKLWVVIDPIGTLPVFLAVTAGLEAAAARRIALQGAFVAFLVLGVFIIPGNYTFVEGLGRRGKTQPTVPAVAPKEQGAE